MTMPNDKIAEELRALAQKLRNDTAKLETFAFGRLTVNELRQVTETAHLTALHVARCMEAYAGFIDENATWTHPSIKR